MSADRVVAAIRRGTAFIALTQLADGNFESDSSPAKNPFRPARAYQTTFTTSLILKALSSLPQTHIPKVRQRMAEWLLAQKSPAWSFNYWASDEPARNQLTYPDDLDDTFCALIALHGHDPNLVDEACLGKVVKLLIATEQAAGGPYRTWLVGKDAPAVWQDVDLAVNANIAYFLSLVAEPLPNLCSLLEEAIKTDAYKSPYYPSPFPLLYYIARAYKGPLRPKLAAYLLKKRKQGSWGSPLSTALAISALIQLGYRDDCQPAIGYLLETQASDGSWPAEAFCLDPMLHGKKYYSGASALTTAFALEALTRFSQTPNSIKPQRATTDKTANSLQRRIVIAARQDMQKLDRFLATPGIAMLEQIASRDKTREITLLPYAFNRDLIASAKPNNDFFVKLGLANMYGWTAYTIYDDFLDNEGDPQLLSIANVLQRYSLQCFREALPTHHAFQQLIARTFDQIDSANAWEVANCRFAVQNGQLLIGQLPQFGQAEQLAQRSLGHTLTPMAILALLHVPLDGPAAKALLRSFTHYLIARQLNDDLHDWEEDLQHGIITFVTVKILETLRPKPGAISFAAILPDMQRQFWHTTLPTVCQIITQHTSLARSAVHDSGLLTEHNLLTKILDRIDASVAQTVTEQTKAEDFLAAFTS